MRVISYIARYWNDILVVFLLMVSGVLGASQWIKRNGPIIKDMTTQERIAYITRLLTNLTPIALVLVTDAEIEFGPGTGKLKRSYVIDELYKRIPDEYKKYITEDNLDSIIKNALDEAEALWSSNRDISRMVYGTPRNVNTIISEESYEDLMEKISKDLSRQQKMKGETMI